MELPARMPIIALAVTDLPLPDSPTIAKVLPFSKSKLISLTACTLPDTVLKEIIRFLTYKILFTIIHQLLSVMG